MKNTSRTIILLVGGAVLGILILLLVLFGIGYAKGKSYVRADELCIKETQAQISKLTEKYPKDKDGTIRMEGFGSMDQFLKLGYSAYHSCMLQKGVPESFIQKRIGAQ